MLSIEQNSISTETAVISSQHLSQKLELHANNLLECIQKQKDPQHSSWIVFDLKGKILATGATPSQNERSEYLF